MSIPMVYIIPAVHLSRNMETKHISETEFCPRDVCRCLDIVLINFTIVVIKLIAPQWYRLLRACFVQATGTNSDLHLQGHGCHDLRFRYIYWVSKRECAQECAAIKWWEQDSRWEVQRDSICWAMLWSVLHLSYKYESLCSLSPAWPSPSPFPDCLVDVTACTFQFLWGFSLVQWKDKFWLKVLLPAQPWL